MERGWKAGDLFVLVRGKVKLLITHARIPTLI